MGYNYIGAQADINVWNPNVELTDDFTTAQIWLKAGNGPLFESVEAGWVVIANCYSISLTHFSLTKGQIKSTYSKFCLITAYIPLFL